MLSSLDSWSKSLDCNAFTDVVYIDYAKAFDSVCHSKLLFKLEVAYGISGNVLSWIKQFLSNRMQQVKVGGSMSECSSVLSGVRGEQAIPSVTSVPDLGVQIDGKLSFTEHVAKITRKAYYSLHVPFKCFLTSDIAAYSRVPIVCSSFA